MDAQEYFPWCLKQLLAGKVISLSSVEDLPAEAARDKESCHHFGIKSALTIPLSVGGGPLIGALSFNEMKKERVWSDALVKRLQLVAQIFANAITRKRAEQALEERLQFEQLLADLSATFINQPPDPDRRHHRRQPEATPGDARPRPKQPGSIQRRQGACAGDPFLRSSRG